MQIYRMPLYDSGRGRERKIYECRYRESGATHTHTHTDLEPSPSVLISASTERSLATPHSGPRGAQHARARLAHPPLDTLDRAEPVERSQRGSRDGRRGTIRAGSPYPRDVAREAGPARRPTMAPPLAQRRAERFAATTAECRVTGTPAKGGRGVPHRARVRAPFVVAPSERMAAPTAARGSEGRFTTVREILQSTVGRGSAARDRVRLVVELESRERSRRQERSEGRSQRVPGGAQYNKGQL